MLLDHNVSDFFRRGVDIEGTPYLVGPALYGRGDGPGLRWLFDEAVAKVSC